MYSVQPPNPAPRKGLPTPRVPFWPRSIAATEATGPDPYGNPDPRWLAIDWAPLLRSIDLDGARIEYVEAGPSPGAERDRLDIVLVHGLSGCWQNWLDVIPALAQRHRVVALDLPGFGSSPVPEWAISIEAYSRVLHDFCQAIGIRDAALVGHSMGGFIAAEAVISDPDRFEKLILVSAAGVSSRHLRERPVAVFTRGMAAASPWIFRFQTSTFRRPRARAAAFRGIFTHPDLLRPEYLWEAFQGGGRGSAFAQAMTSLVGYDITERLTEVEVPALVIWGANDMIVPPVDAYGYHKRLRNSALSIYADTGHMPMAERSTRFLRDVQAFIASGTGGPDGDPASLEVSR